MALSWRCLRSQGWNKGLPDKLGEFIAVWGTALVVLFLGLIFPQFFVIYAFSAALILIFGTLAIFGIKFR